MLQCYTSTELVAGASTPLVLVHGRNKPRVITVGVEGYSIDKSPFLEPMLVHLFSSVLLDTNRRYLQGAAIHLGMLTGEMNEALVMIRAGIQGRADLYVTARGPFRADYGLGTYVDSLVSANYYMRTVVIYEPV